VIIEILVEEFLLKSGIELMPNYTVLHNKTFENIVFSLC